MAYIIFVFIGVIVLAGLAVSAFHRREVMGGLPFSILMAFSAFWLLGIGVMVTRSTPASALIWYKFQFVSISSLPVILVIFVTAFNAYEGLLTTKRIALLFIIPIITQIVVWNDDWFPLLFQEIVIEPKGGLMMITSFVPGLWFNMISAYGYGLAVFAMGWLLVRAIRQLSLYRNQSIAIIVSTLAVMLPNVLFSFDLLPPDVSILPFGFLLMGILIYWSMFNNKFLDVVPIARNKLVDSMSDGMLLIDVQGRIVDLNVAMHDFLVTAHPEYRSQPLSALIGQPAGKILQPWQELVQKYGFQNNVQVEIELKVAGTTKYWDLRISLVKTRRGQIGGRLIIMRDITSRVVAETAVIAAKETAEQAVETLRHTNEELAASNAELEAFAHTVAHDLKAPLGNIASFSVMLNTYWDRLTPEEVQSYLDIIAKEGDKSVRIVDDLLLLSRVRQKDEVEIMPLDMGLVVCEVLARSQKMISNYQAAINVADSWPAVMGHLPWIEVVWMNYLSNSLKYGGEPPDIELGATAQSNGHHRFWIKDNGPGLTEDEQAKLFTPFTRLHQSRAEGHGLGLSIVQRIVEKLDGQVGVESKVGDGATFYFTLPSAE